LLAANQCEGFCPAPRFNAGNAVRAKLGGKIMKRLFINLPQRFAFTLRNPGYSIKSLLREALGTDERFLAAISSSKLKAIRDYLDEPFRDTKFYSHLRE
jgi:hypothetical protein